MYRRTVLVGALAVIAVASVGYGPRAHAIDAFGVLGKTLGLTKDQAAGGLGSILTLAQEKLAKGDFDKVAAAIPGASKYLKQAKSLGAVTGPLKNVTGLKGALAKLGIDEKTASSFLAAVPDIVSKTGGADVGKLLSSVLGG